MLRRYSDISFETFMATSYNYPAEMVCLICSDKAEGYHFGAVSCAACGAFFRRSISEQKVYQCLSRQCDISFDPSKRGGCCRFCRFFKCLISGMMPFEVRAKRSSQNNSPAASSNFSPDAIVIIDELVNLRRRFSIERQQVFQQDPTTSSFQTINLFTSLCQEFSIFRLIANQAPILNKIIMFNPILSADWTRLSQTDPIRTTFIFWFMFDSCVLTANQGGVQLNRLIFTNMAFQEIVTSSNQPSQLSFLVQVIARNLQSAHFDEVSLAVLLFLLLTDNIPRSLEINQRRSTLLSEIDKTSLSQFPSLFSELSQGFSIFQHYLLYSL